MKAHFSSKGGNLVWRSRDAEAIKAETSPHRVSQHFPERDWREKQKVMDDLMETVELQRKDLDSLQKDIHAKEKLCSALRVSIQTVFYFYGNLRTVARF